MATALMRKLREFTIEFDAVVPISDPLLWATHCSLDAAVLLLRAYACSATHEDERREAVLDAIAAARASVVAVTFAAQTTMHVVTRKRRSTQTKNNTQG